MQLKDVLIKNGFHFNKRFGQNFLTDKNLLDEIVEKAGVTKDDTVIEIGCGAGALTAALARKAKKVVGYETYQIKEPVYGYRTKTVTTKEYRYRTRTFIPGTVTYKWSYSSNDKTLISQGYTYTGIKKEV